MTPSEFSSRIKTKYPQYADLDDTDLAQRMITKYPEYKDQVQFDRPSTGEAALRGAAQGLTLGYAPQITGALESTLSNKPYKQAEEESAQAYQAAKSAHPYVTGATEMAGSIPTYMGASALMGPAGPVVAGAAQGASTGGLKGAAIGAGLGLAGEAAGAVAGKVLGTIPEAAQAIERRAVGFKPGMLDEPGQLAKANQAVQAIKEKGMLGADPSKTLAETGQMGQEAGQTIGSLHDSLDAHGYAPGVSLEDIARNLHQDIMNPRNTAQDQSALIDAWNEIRGHPIEGNKPTFNELADLKYKLDRNVSDWTTGPQSADTAPKARAYQTAYDAVNDALDKGVQAASDQSGEPALATTYQAAKQNYGTSKTLQTPLLKAQAQEAQANWLVHPLQTAERVGMKYAGVPAALGADKVSTLFKQGVQALGRFYQPLANAAAQSPQAFAVTSYVLQQRDPEFRAVVGGANQ